MNHLRVAFAASMAITLAMLSACGDEVTEVTKVVDVQSTPISTVSSEKDLPDCDDANSGLFVITKDKKDVYVCYSKKWYVLNGKDGSAGAKDGSDGKNGKDGKNGSDGEDGTSCTGVPFSSGDSTGFKIV